MLMTRQEKAMKRIQEDVVLVRVQMKKPSTVKKSDRLSESTAMSKGIDVASVKTSLTKMKHDNLDRYSKVLAEARKYLAFRSTAYGDDGWRMVRVKFLPDIEAKLEELKLTAEELATTIVSEDYDGIVENAKARLGSEFEWVEFPSKEELAAGFGFEIRKTCVESGADIHINAAASVVRDIQEEMDSNVAEAGKKAVSEVAGRMQAVCKTAIETLEPFDEGQKKLKPLAEEEKKLKRLINNKASKATAKKKGEARVRIKEIQEERKKHRVRNNGHSIENVKELVQVMDMVNTTSNPDIEAIGKRMGKVFEKFTGDNVKKDPKLRKEAINASKSMLKDMQDIGFIKTD